ncbi:MAG: hypothetical protein IKU61_06025 [Clostridia bacterium]|nr:hypothetical protein [Clostridia bacterium]
MEKNVHSGHRQRLKARFLREGLYGFEKHNVLELLLFYAIPLKDTNQIAHALIDKFGSLKRVFEASVEELCTVEGISEHTATLIKLVPAVWQNVAGETSSKAAYPSLNKLAKLMIERYEGVTVEITYLVLLDAGYHIIEIVKLEEGSVNHVRFDIRKVVEHVLRTNASMILLAHNHPGGSAIPSTADVVSTEAAAQTLATLNIDFLEHIVIAGDRYEPIMSNASGTFYQKSKRNAFYSDK